MFLFSRKCPVSHSISCLLSSRISCFGVFCILATRPPRGHKDPVFRLPHPPPPAFASAPPLPEARHHPRLACDSSPGLQAVTRQLVRPQPCPFTALAPRPSPESWALVARSVLSVQPPKFPKPPCPRTLYTLHATLPCLVWPSGLLVATTSGKCLGGSSPLLSQAWERVIRDQTRIMEDFLILTLTPDVRPCLPRPALSAISPQPGWPPSTSHQIAYHRHPL